MEPAATEVLLMNTFQAYFEYEMMAGCGIPQVTLLGTPDDWRSMRRRASMLSEFELTWWTDALLPVLDQIVETAEGQVDQGFWRSFFRYQSGSGPAELTGWILTLFPYLEGERTPEQNPHLAGRGSVRSAQRNRARLGASIPKVRRSVCCPGPSQAPQSNSSMHATAPNTPSASSAACSGSPRTKTKPAPSHPSSAGASSTIQARRPTPRTQSVKRTVESAYLGFSLAANLTGR
jgi:hypothetical protein